MEIAVAGALIVLGGAVVLAMTLRGTAPAPHRATAPERPEARSQHERVIARTPPREPALAPIGTIDAPLLGTSYEVVPPRGRIARTARFVLGIAALAFAAAVGVLAIARGIVLLVERLVRL